jgi:hypothetical protein
MRAGVAFMQMRLVHYFEALWPQFCH